MVDLTHGFDPQHTRPGYVKIAIENGTNLEIVDLPFLKIVMFQFANC